MRRFVAKYRLNQGWTRIFSKKVEISDEIIFTDNVDTYDMYGCYRSINAGTKGMVTDKNVIHTSYDIRWYGNYEVTYHNGDEKCRVLIRSMRAPIRKSR